MADASHLFDTSHVATVTTPDHTPDLSITGGGSEHGASLELTTQDFHGGGSTDFHGNNSFDGGYTYHSPSTGDYSVDYYHTPSDQGITGTWTYE